MDILQRCRTSIPYFTECFMLKSVVRIAVCACVVAFVTSATCPCHATAATGNTDAEFVKAAVAGWDGLALKMRNVTGQVDWVKNLRSTNQSHYKDSWVSEKVQFWITEREGKVVADVFDKHNKWLHQYVYCYNREYAFGAVRHEREGVYVLTEYARDDERISRMKSVIRHYVPRLQSPYDIDGDTRTLSQIAVSPDFSLASCRDVQNAGRSFKELVFSFSPSADFAPYDRSVRHCQLLVEPSASWRIVKSVLRDATWDVNRVNSYAGSGDEPARLTRVEELGKANDGTDDDYHIEYTTLSFQPTRPAEFRLSAIGMPEIPSPGRRRWLMLLIVGGNLLLIGLVLAALYRRRVRLSRL